MNATTNKESEMKAIVNNNFHGSSKNIRLNDGKNIIYGRRLRNWKNALCCSGCTCSGIGGLRGDSDAPSIVDDSGNPVEWETGYDNQNGKEYLIVWA